ncbi:MAG: class I SAM-dependent methyltransferase [Candidatus Daviesbacteria bacterium]|nr:class I SAM-dependent methyltransferase [Candidatus Daviesbacteria bacterium]
MAIIFDPVQHFFNGDFWKIFLKKYGKFHDKKVIDIACGTGELRKYIDPTKYLGVDINSAYINYANKNNRYKNSKFILEDATKFNLDDKYDIAFLISAAHHLTTLQLEGICINLKKNKVKEFIIIDGIPIGFFAGMLKFLDDKLGGGSFFKDEDEISRVVQKYFLIKDKGKFGYRSLFYEYPFVVAKLFS